MDRLNQFGHALSRQHPGNSVPPMSVRLLALAQVQGGIASPNLLLPDSLTSRHMQLLIVRLYCQLDLRSRPIPSRPKEGFSNNAWSPRRLNGGFSICPLQHAVLLLMHSNAHGFLQIWLASESRIVWPPVCQQPQKDCHEREGERERERISLVHSASIGL